MSRWPDIIKDMQAERPKISTRELCVRARIPRTAFQTFLATGDIRVDYLEAVLGVFGHELDAVRKDAEAE